MSDEDLSDKWFRFNTQQTLERQKPKRMAVAVSGGGDSMACLELMRWHSQSMGFSLQAVTLDHGLRPEAGEEIALVAAYCAKHELPHTVLRWGWDGEGNLQAAARNARYKLIAAWALQNKVDQIALGHTEDDIAETFLMRLARKSGVDGLATMACSFERNGETWFRPLLSFGRSDLRALLRRHDIVWAEDASNDDPRFERVKARQALDALSGLGIGPDTLSAVAHNMFFAKATLDHYVFEAQWQYGREEEGDLILPGDRDKTFGIPMEIQRRLRCAAIMWVSGGDYKPRSEAMINLEIAMIEGKTHTLGGCLFTLDKGKKRGDRKWRVSREYNAVKDLQCATDELWDGRWALSGAHAPGLEIRALGDALKDCPDWRDTGIPRTSLLASPAVWHENTLISAPLAGFSNGWSAKSTGRGNFADFLLSR